MKLLKEIEVSSVEIVEEWGYHHVDQ